MKEEHVLIFLKFISIVFLVLFFLIITVSIIYYQNKFIFTLLLLFFLLFLIPSILYYKHIIKYYIKKDYKEIEEKTFEGKIYRFSKIKSNTINDYQRALKDLKEKNTYILGRYDVLNNIKKLYKKDMDKARKLQEAMLPKKMPNNSLISSSYFYKPVESVGGDFFDYVIIDENKILFIISDVSGHGVEAAIVTSMLKAAFRSLSKSFISASDFVYNINNYLIDILPINYYLTMTVSLIDLKENKLIYSNASHTPLMLIRDGSIIEYTEGGTIIGLFKNAYYAEEIIDLKKDDILVFFTDGIIEASRSKNKYDLYGINRLKNTILNNDNKKVDNIIESVKEDFYDYLSYIMPDDDFTMIMFKIK